MVGTQAQSIVDSLSNAETPTACMERVIITHQLNAMRDILTGLHDLLARRRLELLITYIFRLLGPYHSSPLACTLTLAANVGLVLDVQHIHWISKKLCFSMTYGLLEGYH
jgi:hypothetical protein